MKKNILLTNKILYSTLITLFILTGCSTSKQNVEISQEKANKIEINSNDKAIAYAYFKDGTKLVEISTKYTEPTKESDIEVVKISKTGLFPLDIVSANGSEICVKSLTNGLGVIGEKPHITKHCNSTYSKIDKKSTSVGVVAGLFSGLWITGTTFFSYEFDKEGFSEIMNENNLMSYKRKLVELINYANNAKETTNKLYENKIAKYTSNINNISIKNVFIDNSGLFKNKNFTTNFKIKPLVVDKIVFSYNEFFQDISLDLNNIDTQFIDIKNKIDQKLKRDLIEYETYLNKFTAYYKLVGNNKITFKYNDKISFNANIVAPSKIQNKSDLKVVDIKIYINNVDLTKIVPNNFILKDKNINVSFNFVDKYDISGIISNQTKSFVTVSAITSYYNKDVYTLSNINKELAPESKSLKSNSTYSVLNNANYNYNGVTKKSINNITVDYGFAIKYKINNTDLEKTIYDKKSYSLYNLFIENLN